jgi:hypothetical protein
MINTSSPVAHKKAQAGVNMAAKIIPTQTNIMEIDRQ